MDRAQANGGLPRPRQTEPVRVLETEHQGCGHTTRMRIPPELPAHAIKSVVCTGCAQRFTPSELTDCGIDSGQPANDARADQPSGPPSVRWTSLRRVLALALLALVAPIPALALEGGGGNAAPATLVVTATLERCGTAGGAVICTIEAHWNPLARASSYTVDVTRPDGSAINLGEVRGSSTPLFVPYSGPGVYTVSVTAWGSRDHVGTTPIARATSAATELKRQPTGSPAPGVGSGQSSDQSLGETTSDPAPTTPAPDQQPPCTADPEDPSAATIPRCPTQPLPPSPSPPANSSVEDRETSSSVAVG